MNRMVASLRQQEILTDFVDKHKQTLVVVQSRSKQGSAASRRLWEECAHELNVNGPPRPPGQWARYWSDWKSRVKRKHEIIKGSQEEGVPCKLNFSGMDMRVLNVMGYLSENKPVDVQALLKDPLCEVFEDLEDSQQDGALSDVETEYVNFKLDNIVFSNEEDVKYDIVSPKVADVAQQHDHAYACPEQGAYLIVNAKVEPPDLAPQDQELPTQELQMPECKRSRGEGSENRNEGSTPFRRKKAQRQTNSSSHLEEAQLRLEERRLEVELMRARAEQGKAEAAARIAAALEAIAATITLWK